MCLTSVCVGAIRLVGDATVSHLEVAEVALTQFEFAHRPECWQVPVTIPNPHLALVVDLSLQVQLMEHLAGLAIDRRLPFWECDNRSAGVDDHDSAVLFFCLDAMMACSCAMACSRVSCLPSSCLPSWLYNAHLSPDFLITVMRPFLILQRSQGRSVSAAGQCIPYFSE